ncbi:ABC transporter permease subunit [Streptomyces sp. NPDC093225]|uniref:ABC transporter permease subunit n=1 Tax=Streptomyces sp. NPDC093225 TaxID=3366034 RepID=UPI00382D796B
MTTPAHGAGPRPPERPPGEHEVKGLAFLDADRPELAAPAGAGAPAEPEAAPAPPPPAAAGGGSVRRTVLPSLLLAGAVVAAYLWSTWTGPDPVAGPALADPALVGPALTDPGLTDPGLTAPGPADPGSADPGSVDPAATGPAGAAGAALGDPALTGGAVRLLLWDHLRLTAAAACWALLLGVPLGIALSRRALRPAVPVVARLAVIGRAVPAIGLLALLVVAAGPGPATAVAAMAAYGALPVVARTARGLRAVDPALVRAARALGMSGPATLRRVELPLAAPAVLSGVRQTLVMCAGAAALAVFAGGGGLGALIVAGLRTGRAPVLVLGAVLAVAVALLADWLGVLVAAVLTPRGAAGRAAAGRPDPGRGVPDRTTEARTEALTRADAAVPAVAGGLVAPGGGDAKK